MTRHTTHQTGYLLLQNYQQLWSGWRICAFKAEWTCLQNTFWPVMTTCIVRSQSWSLRSTRYQIHKKWKKSTFFFKVSTHSLQLRVKFKPFFHCWQLQLIYSYRTSAAPIFALKLWTCLLHTLNSQRGFVMKHAWSWTIYTLQSQAWNLLLLMACWKRVDTNTLYYTCAGSVVSF